MDPQFVDSLMSNHRYNHPKTIPQMNHTKTLNKYHSSKNASHDPILTPTTPPPTQKRDPAEYKPRPKVSKNPPITTPC